MKKLLLSCLGICLFSSVSFAGMDFKCFNDCRRMGYSWGYCQDRCSYDDNSYQKTYDLKCFKECRSMGYSWAYCQDLCSYDNK
jgi:hypothetical protein